jgi:hypothetical protein
MWNAVVKNLCCVHVISYAHLDSTNAVFYDEFKTATENVFLVFFWEHFFQSLINETKEKNPGVIYTYFVKNNQFLHTFSLAFFLISQYLITNIISCKLPVTWKIRRNKEKIVKTFFIALACYLQKTFLYLKYKVYHYQLVFSVFNR